MARFGFGRATKLVAVMALAAAPALAVVSQTAAGAATTATVTSEGELRSAFLDLSMMTIDLGSNITITASTCAPKWVRADLSNPLTIDGHGFTVTQTCSDTGIFHSVDISAPLTFRNITLTGGSTEDSGGAIDSGGAVTVINSTVTGNSAVEDGGGIWGTRGVTVEGSTVSNNTAAGTGGGGGISALGHVWVTNSTVTNNTQTGPASGDGGGGIASAPVVERANVGAAVVNDGGITVTGSTISNNTTSSEGGGLAADGTVEVTDSTISGNTAAHDSGGFDAPGGATVTRSTISGNRASGDGGGFEAGSDTTVTNSTITNNTAGDLGGGINMWTGNLTLAYDTITKNAIDVSIAGVKAAADASSVPELGAKGAAPEAAEGPHATVTGQAANVQIGGDGGGVLTSFGTVIAQPQGSVPNCMVVSTASQGYNFSDDGSGNSCRFDTSTDTHLATNDAKLGALGGNGGPTLTMLPSPGSPLIDAIPTGSCSSSAPTDQRGVSRPQIHGCDIGAVEVKGASVNVTKVVTGVPVGQSVPSTLGYSFKVTCSDGTTGTLAVADATLGGTSGTVDNILPGATCSVVEAPVVYNTNPKVTGQPVPAYKPATTAALAEAETATITVTNDYSLVNLLGETVVRPPLVLQPRFTG